MKNTDKRSLEIRIWAATLECAIKDSAGWGIDSPLSVREAQNWLQSDSTTSNSFLATCQYLSIPSGVVRKVAVQSFLPQQQVKGTTDAFRTSDVAQEHC